MLYNFKLLFESHRKIKIRLKAVSEYFAPMFEWSSEAVKTPPCQFDQIRLLSAQMPAALSQAARFLCTPNQPAFTVTMKTMTSRCRA